MEKSMTERNYKREYENYHSKPEQKKRRAARNATRRKKESTGAVKKGDGKDVHHRDGNPRNQSSDNLAVLPKGRNRAMKEDKLRQKIREMIQQEARSPKKFDQRTRVKVKDKGGSKYGYELGMGYLGNGLTIWNRNLEIGGDYAKVAHVDSPTGKIRWYDKNVPPEVKKEIEFIAKGEKKSWDQGTHTYQTRHL